jgi:4-amino-4-deoxy-L-arabinose transferase-like glycosyltransferase
MDWSKRSGAPLVLVIVAVWLSFGFVSLATHTFLPIDETRYVTVAWNMWLRGDFLVPWLNDVAYHHKPPLLFWAIHAGWSLTGVNEWWPRIVPGLFGLAATGLTWRMARMLWPDDERAAWLAPVVLVGCLWWALFAAATMFDMLIACFTVLGMFGILVAAGGQPARGFALVGVALGLGLLAKGPTILLQVLPAALLAPWWMSARPRRGWGAWYGGVLAAFLLGAAIGLAWAIPAALRGGPEYARMLFWGQTADRMVNAFAHQAPAWWYLALAPALVFPWLFWPPMWRALFTLPARMDLGLRFTIAWAAPVFIAFSLISGKQGHYLLPLLPAAALLGARLLAGATPRLERRSQVLPAMLAILAGVGIATASLVAPHFNGARWIEAVPPLGGTGLIAWGLLLLAPKRPRLETAAALVAGISVILVNTADIAVVHAAGPAYDQRATARYLKDLELRGLPVAHVGKYHGQFQFLGRLERTPDIIALNEVDNWFTSHPDGRVITYAKKLPADAAPEYRQNFSGRIVAVFDRAGWSNIGSAKLGNDDNPPSSE